MKIDPKAIGVGQYQHDMKPARLDEALGGVVEDCVNSVGVDINTASCALLSYVSGITTASAKNIVAQREDKGEFKSRAEIKKVPRIGPKAYEMCAGFLRVPGSDEILDNTGVHPESYAAAKTLLSELEYTEDDVRARRLGELRSRSEKYGIKRLCEKLGVGEPTFATLSPSLKSRDATRATRCRRRYCEAMCSSLATSCRICASPARCATSPTSVCSST